MGDEKEKRKRDDLESTLPNVDPSDNWDGCLLVFEFLWNLLALVFSLWWKIGT